MNILMTFRFFHRFKFVRKKCPWIRFIFISFLCPWSLAGLWPSLATRLTFGYNRGNAFGPEWIKCADFLPTGNFFWNVPQFQSRFFHIRQLFLERSTISKPIFLFLLARKKSCNTKHRRLLLFWRSGFFVASNVFVFCCSILELDRRADGRKR